MLTRLFKQILSILSKEKTLDPQIAFDIWSDSYDIDNNIIADLDDVFVKESALKVTLRDKTLLDYGCGTGSKWDVFSSQFPRRLVGVDISPAMIARLKTKYSNAVTLLLDANSYALPFPGSSFDAVACNLMWGYISKPLEAVCEIDRVLVPGGHVIWSDIHPNIFVSGGRRTFKSGSQVYAIKDYSSTNIPAVADHFRSHGFDIISTQELRIRDLINKTGCRELGPNIVNRMDEKMHLGLIFKKC